MYVQVGRPAWSTETGKTGGTATAQSSEVPAKLLIPLGWLPLLAAKSQLVAADGDVRSVQNSKMVDALRLTRFFYIASAACIGIGTRDLHSRASQGYVSMSM